MSKIVFITGATAGIGEATAEKFAAEGYNLIINGRREQRLKDLSNRLAAAHNVWVKPLCFDVSDKAAVKNSIASLSDEEKQIDVLVNNAGLAQGFDDLQDGKEEDWDVMIDVNVKGLLYVTKQIMLTMIKRESGHIINLGSIAGKRVYSKGNVYCSTKFAVDALTQAMRMDLLRHKIRVTAIHPGAVETEFSMVRFDGDQQKADAVYRGYEPLVAKDIAESIYFTASQPPHVNINELTIMPTAQASPYHWHKGG